MPLRIQLAVGAALQGFHRHKLGRDPFMSIDPDHFGGGEPVEAAGKPRDLTIKAKWGIDERRRANEGAHYMPALQRGEMLLPQLIEHGH
jgi:hypothetical protein